MGILGLFLAYRAGRRRAARRFDLDQEYMQETCDNCGFERVQHDDQGRCPTYHHTPEENR